ncbi:RICIN domain-containing protein [Streptomyces sp. 11x1]
MTRSVSPAPTVPGAGTANGTRATLWSCNGGTDQQWSRR